jgi:hypothetical protein
MILELSILGLAILSDSEPEPEGSEWIRRFEEIDSLRFNCEIPFLSAQERMAVVLGKNPTSKDYILSTFHEQTKHQGWFRIFVGKLEEGELLDGKRSFLLRRWCLFADKFKSIFDAMSARNGMAKALFLPATALSFSTREPHHTTQESLDGNWIDLR